MAQTLYLTRHNAALKILFFEMLMGYQLVDAISPWYSSVQPKPLYQDDKATAYWDVPVFAEHLQVRGNRVDARFVDSENVNKEVMLIEMSCPWMDNRKQKEEEKALKYAPLRLELKRQHPRFKIRQSSIAIDPRNLMVEVKMLVGSDRCRQVLRRIQKAVLSHTFHIAKTFKVMCQPLGHLLYANETTHKLAFSRHYLDRD